MRKAEIALLCFVFTSGLTACGGDDAIQAGADPDALGAQSDAQVDTVSADGVAPGDAATSSDAAADAPQGADTVEPDASVQDGTLGDATVVTADTTGADANVACVPADCADANPCTTDFCTAGTCTHSAIPRLLASRHRL